jgi:hypothetical protein
MIMSYDDDDDHDDELDSLVSGIHDGHYITTRILGIRIHVWHLAFV